MTTDAEEIVAAAREWFAADEALAAVLAEARRDDGVAWERYADANERHRVASEQLRAVMRLDATKTAEAAS